MENQIKINSFSEKFDSSIDLLICSSSFEDRCFCIPEQISNIDKLPKKVFVCFNTNEYKDVSDNAAKLAKMFPKRAQLIALNSDNPLQNSITLNLSLEAILHEKKLKNIFLDTTTFTHETLLVLLRLLIFKKDYFEKLFIGYVGAANYSINEKDEDKWLSTGISDIRSIIGYPGVPSPAKKFHLIVLFGFESERTKKLIDDYQFDKVSIAFGTNPIKNSHLELNYLRHQELTKLYPYAEAFQVDLSNPFLAKKQVAEQYQKYTGYNTVIAPMNNKISTIGVGLAAIDDKRIQLIYAKPNRYNNSGYSTPSDDCYIYQIL